jgi:hypothetical protein
MKWSILLVSLALVEQPGPMNLDFEQGEIGQVPRGWFCPTRSSGGGAEITAENPRSGKKCALIAGSPTGFSNLMQSFDATPYRGKTIRLRAAVRTDGSARAQMWLRVDRPGGVMGFFDNMDNRPILSANWGTYIINGDVAGDAAMVNIGVFVVGAGRAWVDDASFEITGEVKKAPVEPPRSLGSRGLANLVALTRLLGYARYFHPSDEAASADWESFAIEAVRSVEGVRDANELAARLGTLFKPVAPLVRVFPTARPATPPVLEPTAKLVRWRHHGLGTVAVPSLYYSKRVIEDAPSGKISEPFAAELGGGVSCLVPLALPAPAEIKEARREPSAVRWSGNDRATRLADVMLAWNVFQHFYPYFDVVKTDWPGALRTALSAAAADKDEEAFVTTLRRLVAALHDGHGGVYFAASRPRYGPAVLWDWIEGRLVVTHVASAQIRDLAPGDAVLAIDGKPAEKALAEAEELISGATPQWIRYNALRQLATGNQGSSVVLRVEPWSARGTARDVSVVCDSMPMTLNDPRPDKVKEVEPGIFYVNVDQITDSDWQAALPRLEKASGIVFDFRGYPRNIKNVQLFFGRLCQTPITSARWHVPVITAPDRITVGFERSGEWRLVPQAPYLKAKRAFLTDGRAISYAESCLGIVEYYKLGEIVGGPTAGTNGNVNPLNLPGGYRITWTGMKVLKQDGSRHHGVGILPTIPVTRTRAGVAAGRDEILERGIRAVKEDAPK